MTALLFPLKRVLHKVKLSFPFLKQDRPLIRTYADIITRLCQRTNTQPLNLNRGSLTLCLSVMAAIITLYDAGEDGEMLN